METMIGKGYYFVISMKMKSKELILLGVEDYLRIRKTGTRLMNRVSEMVLATKSDDLSLIPRAQSLCIPMLYLHGTCYYPKYLLIGYRVYCLSHN